MKKTFKRRITDALGITMPTTAFRDAKSFNFNLLPRRHIDLTDKQILLLQQMIDNYNQHDIPICKCDVERVLDTCNAEGFPFDDSLPTRLEGSD